MKHKHITKYMPAVHALTGFDTVSYLFGNGKAAAALNILMGGHHLIKLGQQRAYEDKLISEVTTFVAACYGSKIEGDMTTRHYQMWKFKILGPLQYGWHAGDDDTTLYRTTLSAGVSPSPLTILHLVKCGCSTSRPCSTVICGCMAAQMSCSVFCSCNGGSDCCNGQPRIVAANPAADEEDDV